MTAVAPRTIVDKIWTEHVVTQDEGAPVGCDAAARLALCLQLDSCHGRRSIAVEEARLV